MIRYTMCMLFGHQPEHYELEEGVKTTEYWECARCAKRKAIDGRGWT